MSTISRRLLSTTSRLAQESSGSSVPLDLASTPVPGEHLPRVLQRHIARQLTEIQLASGGTLPPTVDIPNPFIVQRGPRRADSEVTGEQRYHWSKPVISNRRQKQLLAYHPAVDLPASRLNAAVDRPVHWGATTIRWSGEGPSRLAKDEERVKKGVYAGRKMMFKGHKDERGKAQKEADRKARMDGMDKRIAEWRQGKTEEKLRNRPSLPF